MAKENFLDMILADPLTGEKLIASPTGYTNVDSKFYPVQENIPDFISGQSYTAPQSALHIQEGTYFHYREHYKADASYFNYSDGDDSAVTREERKRNRQAIIHAVDTNTGIMLDIGCGDGWVAKHFSEKAKVVSMDLAITNPLKAVQKYRSPHHAGVVADGMFLPFMNGSFDTIIASEVIEHLADPAGFVKGCMQKLKTGGQLILVTPYNEKLRYHICVHCNHPTPESAHLHSFHEKNIKDFLGEWKYRSVAFNNRYALKMRLYTILSFLPFSLWKMTDKTANAFFHKPLTFMIVIRK